MAFKQNLLMKIRIDRLTSGIIASVGSADSDKKTDKEAMKQLLEMSSYRYRKERDLNLYISDQAEVHKILVLDNELAIYDSTPQDVGLRKSPTVREMLNVFNVIKILNDSDVVKSKREESVRIIQRDCIARLDLSFGKTDIEEIEIDGMASLESGYAEGVTESLSLFAELLNYVSAPKTFQISGHRIMGKLHKKENGETLFGSVIIYSIIHNTLKRIDKQLSTSSKEDHEFLSRIALGKEKASQESIEVFRILKDVIIAQYLTSEPK